MTDDFWEFIERRKQAASAYVNGDSAPLSTLLCADSPATFFSPSGDVVEGCESVAARYAGDAGIFDTDSQTDLEILDADASGDVAYWVGYQNATVRLKDQPEPVSMKLRITEIFRKEDGAWKLIHRHADTHGQAYK